MEQLTVRCLGGPATPQVSATGDSLTLFLSVTLSLSPRVGIKSGALILRLGHTSNLLTLSSVCGHALASSPNPARYPTEPICRRVRGLVQTHPQRRNILASCLLTPGIFWGLHMWEADYFNLLPSPSSQHCCIARGLWNPWPRRFSADTRVPSFSKGPGSEPSSQHEPRTTPDESCSTHTF